MSEPTKGQAAGPGLEDRLARIEDRLERIEQRLARIEQQREQGDETA